MVSTAPPSAPNDQGPEAKELGARAWLEHFRRITSSGRYIDEIDGIRFVAIAMVVVYHVLVFAYAARGGPVERLTALGRGVEMFYVLSGFVLAMPFAAYFLADGKPVSLSGYLLRRVTRLEPPFLLCVLIFAVLKWAQADYDPTLWLRTLLGAFYVHDLVLGRPGMIVSVAWSLEVEVQFYLLMPMLSWIFAVRPTTLRRAILIAAIFLTPLYQPILLPAYYMPNDGNLLNFIQFFLVGLLLADIWVVNWKNAPPPMSSGKFLLGDVICGGLMALLLIVPRDRPIQERFLLAPAIGVLYLAMFRSVWTRRLMRLELVTLIGGMCYSIYLMHNLAIRGAGLLVGRVLPKGLAGASVVSAVMMLPVVLFVSAIYFRVIERPCMYRDWPRRLRCWIVQQLFVESKG